MPEIFCCKSYFQVLMWIDIYDAVKPVEIVTLYAVMFFVFNPNYGVCTMNYELQKAIRWLLRRGPTSSHSEQRS